MARCTMPSSSYAPEAISSLVSGRPNRITPPMPSALHFGALLHQLVDGQLVIARHGADFAPHAFAGADEQRQDELRRMEMGFAHQAAHGFGGAQAAQAYGGKGHHTGLYLRSRGQIRQ